MKIILSSNNIKQKKPLGKPKGLNMDLPLSKHRGLLRNTQLLGYKLIDDCRLTNADF
jgi:hypothetical protein